MPFDVGVEVLVNFLKFRNVDLLHQGLYYVACSVRGEAKGEHGERHRGDPVLLLQSKAARRRSSWAQEGDAAWPGAFADPESGAAGTRAFMVHYQEQVDVLNDSALFRPARAAGFGGELRRHKAGEPLASAASRLFHCT
eukprot:gene12426-12664_t